MPVLGDSEQACRAPPLQILPRASPLLGLPRASLGLRASSLGFPRPASASLVLPRETSSHLAVPSACVQALSIGWVGGSPSCLLVGTGFRWVRLRTPLPQPRRLCALSTAPQHGPFHSPFHGLPSHHSSPPAPARPFAGAPVRPPRQGECQRLARRLVLRARQGRLWSVRRPLPTHALRDALGGRRRAGARADGCLACLLAVCSPSARRLW